VVILTNLRNDSVVEKMQARYERCLYLEKPIMAREFNKRVRAFIREL